MNTILVRRMTTLLALAAAGATFACASVRLATFATPDQAMQTLADVVGTHDSARVEQLFGSDGAELLKSGDDVADREDAQKVKADIQEKVAFEDHGAGTKIALLGNDGWPFPIPLVLDNGSWQFDVEAGREEITSRRIGRNELSTIATMHEYVSAQHEYFSQAHDGNPRAYARKLISSTGKRDGLYWPAAENEPESPLGPLIAAAAQEGYSHSEGQTHPFHGYYYRTLSGQGKCAPGGEKSYGDEDGSMTRGFALLAWPAKYGNSGVMTFQVDRQGIVYQKDLGADTEQVAGSIAAYAPDESWDPTGD